MLKILIVDDEQVVHVNLENLLNSRVCDFEIVATYKNELDAMEVMNKQSIDLLLISISYDLSLVEEVKQRGYDTKVMIISQQDDYEMINQMLKWGLDDYLKNRVTEEEVLLVINHVFKELQKQQIEQRKSENFRLGRQTFLMAILTGKVYYSDDELNHYTKLYQLFDPQFSLFELRFFNAIDSQPFIKIDCLMKRYLRNYDYDMVRLINDKILIIIYESTQLKNHELMVDWLHLIQKIRKNIEADLQISKRFIVDSISKLKQCKVLGQYSSSKEFLAIHPTLNFSHYRTEIQTVLNYIHEHYQERITLQQLAIQACLHEAYLSRLFKRETKKTINSYINELRVYKAKELLKTPNIMIKEVAQLVGIHDQLYFNRVFKKFCGENPTQYQERIQKNEFQSFSFK